MPRRGTSAAVTTVRLLWLLVAVVALGLGVVGIVVPGLPTTPFVILSAWAASRASTRLHDWLRRHRFFGPILATWRQGGRIERRAKWASAFAMAGCAGLLFLVARPIWTAAAGTAVMGVVAVWIWRRPEPTKMASRSRLPS